MSKHMTKEEAGSILSSMVFLINTALFFKDGKRKELQKNSFCSQKQILDMEHKIGIDLTVSSTLKKPSKNYTCFVSRRFGSFLIHLQSKNN